MNIERKKQLLEEYKNKKPEMGIVSFCCKATGESFLGNSKDTKSDFNSIRYRLSANLHPNKQLQALWNRYGENSFELSVLKVLKYEDTESDRTDELEKLREQCLIADSQAMRIWR